MTSPDTTYVDRGIAVLREHHDRLAETLAGLTPEQLEGPSAASEWSLAQVLSHLGSGTEIWYGPYAAALSGDPAPKVDNQSVWDRWNASSPQEQADGFLEHDERFVSMLEDATPEQRASARVDLGFLPEPATLSLALGMRVNEMAAHTWDFLAGLDHDAVLDPTAADLVLEQYAGEGAYMFGFIGKADQLADPTVVGLGDHTLRIEETISLEAGASPELTARFDGSAEAAVRLFSGRLKEGFTAKDVEVTGNVTLEDLRRVFPGY
jgi:uncharacterized protein (TIGR03083 family)